MNDHDRLLDKVRKLLAQAEGAGTEAEADTFNNKAAELIARYGIQEALLAASGAKPDTIDQRRITTPQPYSTDKAQLLGSIAEPLRCRTIRHLRQAAASTPAPCSATPPTCKQYRSCRKSSSPTPCSLPRRWATKTEPVVLRGPDPHDTHALPMGNYVTAG